MIVCAEHPCWTATCDNCGEGDNVEWAGSFHYETEATLLNALTEADWKVFRNEDGTLRYLICPDCWEQMDERRRGELATG